MVNKKIAYLLIILGAIVAVSSYPPIYEIAKTYIPDSLTTNNLIIVGVALVVIGFMLIKASTKRGVKKMHEVPIFHGNEVIGYRRH